MNVTAELVWTRFGETVNVEGGEVLDEVEGEDADEVGVVMMTTGDFVILGGVIEVVDLVVVVVVG
jgi:hypothetical protein